MRRTQNLRNLLSETRLSVDDFIYPMFIRHGNNIKQEISGLPGQYQFSIDAVLEELNQVASLGIKGILLFGIPKNKDQGASEAFSDTGIVQQAIRKIKALFPELLIITDVCLCAYTLDGQCGVVGASKSLHIDNDKSLVVVEKIALSHAKAGADMVAPSCMLDGMVKSIRGILDSNNFVDVGILSYTAKYASGFYGPFRKATDVSLQGDRKTYQMSFHNSKDAVQEAMLDIEEGADILMVKPALAYLDIIKKFSDSFSLPIAAYQVSGEYAMLKAASKAGYLDFNKVCYESLIAIKRSGANLIISYAACEMAKYIARLPSQS